MLGFLLFFSAIALVVQCSSKHSLLNRVNTFADGVSRGEANKSIGGFTSGNLLVTQPNEIFTKHFLAEINPVTGASVAFYPLQYNTHSIQPMDIAFVKPDTLVALAFDPPGLWEVSRDGTVKGAWGNGNSAMGCPWAMNIGGDLLWVLSEGKVCNDPNRVPFLSVFLLNGTEIGTFENLPISDPTSIFIDGITLYVAHNHRIDAFDTITRKLVKTYTGYSGEIYDVVKIYQGYLYLSILLPDYIAKIDIKTGALVQKYPMQHSSPENSGGVNNFLFLENLMYVTNSDSDSIGTQSIQVYDLNTGKYMTGFGGNVCGDYLCQVFNGFVQIPKL